MSEKPKKAVLFDLDGTLIDTAPDFVRIIKVMCAKYGYTCPSDEAIRAQVSAGARAMVRLICGGDERELLRYRQEFLNLYEAKICVDSRLFDGLDALLSDLENQGIAWGIVTNKPRYLAEQLLDALALSARCRVLVCPEDVRQTKPDPEPMYLACQKIDVLPANALYVGDHLRDIQAGRASGMTTVAVRFGYIVPEESPDDWGADAVVDDVAQLSAYVARFVAH